MERTILAKLLYSEVQVNISISHHLFPWNTDLNIEEALKLLNLVPKITYICKETFMFLHSPFFGLHS